MDLNPNGAVSRLAAFYAMLGLWPGVASTQEPTAPQVGLTARCYFPGTIVLRWPAAAGQTATILRASPDGVERELGRVSKGAALYYDVGLAPGARYQYRVKLDTDRVLGPVTAANSAEMLIGGTLEGEPLGETRRTLAFHRAYGPAWWEIVERARPGSTGRQSIKVRHGRPPRRDGLHSRLYPVDPRATYRQTGWRRVLTGSNAGIGRQLLNRELKPAGGRIVAYGYAPVVLEKPGGWQYIEQRLTKLPSDTAFVEVWALAFNSQNTVWFDDLSLVDERVERLAKFDSRQQLAALDQLAAAIGDSSLRDEARELTSTVQTTQTKLRAPQNLPLPKYLKLVAKLDKAAQRVVDLTWDLKILSLAK